MTEQKRSATKYTDADKRLKLSLAELRSLTSLLQAVLLSFLHARIACKETVLLQDCLIFACDNERARNTMTDCAGLSRVATAANVDYYVVLGECVGSVQRLTNDVFQRVETEVIVDITLVDGDCSIATRDESYASDRLLSSACSPELNLFLCANFCQCLTLLSPTQALRDVVLRACALRPCKRGVS